MLLFCALRPFAKCLVLKDVQQEEHESTVKLAFMKKKGRSNERMSQGRMVEFHHIPQVGKKKTCLYGSLPIDWEEVAVVDQMEVVVGVEAASQGAGMAEAEYLMAVGATGRVLATEAKAKGNQRQCSFHSHHLLPYSLPARRHYQA